MGKRGISPLIATVILIAFAVSLGAVVMNLGTNFGSSPSTEASECVGILLQFQDVNGKKITQGGSGAEGFLEFVVLNTGTELSPAVRAIVIGERDGSAQTYVVDLPSSILKPGFPLSKRVQYNYDLYGTPRTVQLVPVIKRGESTIPCFGAAASTQLE